MAAAIVMSAQPAVASDPCQWEVISKTDSPTGEWSAIIQQVYCSDGLNVGVTEIVQIRKIGQALKEDGEVLADDDGANPAERPILTWTSANTLQITVPNLSLLGRYKREYEGVSIALKYIPDDRQARETFYKKLGISPP